MLPYARANANTLNGQTLDLHKTFLQIPSNYDALEPGVTRTLSPILSCLAGKQFQAIAHGTGLNTLGNGLTNLGTGARVIADSKTWQQRTQSTSGSNFGWNTNDTDCFLIAHKPYWRTIIKTYSDISSTRIWIAFTDNVGIFGHATTGTSNYIGLRYDTDAGDTTWKLVTRSASGTAVVTDTTVTVATSTIYDIMLFASATKAWVIINDSAPTEQTVSFSDSQNIFMVMGGQPLVSSARGLLFSHYAAWSYAFL